MKHNIQITAIIWFCIIGIGHGQNSGSADLTLKHLFGEISEAWELKSGNFGDEIVLIKRHDYNENYKGPVIIFYYNGAIITGYSANSFEDSNDGRLQKKTGGWNIDRENKILSLSVPFGNYGSKFKILHLDSEMLKLVKVISE